MVSRWCNNIALYYSRWYLAYIWGMYTCNICALIVMISFLVLQVCNTTTISLQSHFWIFFLNLMFSHNDWKLDRSTAIEAITMATSLLSSYWSFVIKNVVQFWLGKSGILIVIFNLTSFSLFFIVTGVDHTIIALIDITCAQ